VPNYYASRSGLRSEVGTADCFHIQIGLDVLNVFSALVPRFTWESEGGQRSDLRTLDLTSALSSGGQEFGNQLDMNFHLRWGAIVRDCGSCKKEKHESKLY
jgi:hypothetical protein